MNSDVSFAVLKVRTKKRVKNKTKHNLRTVDLTATATMRHQRFSVPKTKRCKHLQKGLQHIIMGSHLFFFLPVIIIAMSWEIR
jgi:hypothetical protein